LKTVDFPHLHAAVQCSMSQKVFKVRGGFQMFWVETGEPCDLWTRSKICGGMASRYVTVSMDQLCIGS